MLLVSILVYVDGVLSFKFTDGIAQVSEYYELEDETVDVLILGSSQAFCNINPVVLWEDYGISSYVLAGSAQPMWNTYYYLKEALKTQTPKLIVLDAFATSYQQSYMDDSRIVQNTYGLKWSIDKIKAITVSSPKERWSDFLLSYGQYHTRYSELSEEDFPALSGYQPDLWKGYLSFSRVEVIENTDVSQITDAMELTGKTEEYYRKIIELAQAEEIPICVIKTPYPGITEEEQCYFNAAEAIAEEYGIEFINYNSQLERLDLDYRYDVVDKSHYNHSGAQKFTRALGADLKSRYELADHRGDAGYASWEADAADFRSYLIAELKAEDHFGEYFLWTDDLKENVGVIIEVKNLEALTDETYRTLLKDNGLEVDMVNEQTDFVCVNFQNEDTDFIEGIHEGSDINSCLGRIGTLVDEAGNMQVLWEEKELYTTAPEAEYALGITVVDLASETVIDHSRWIYNPDLELSVYRE